MPSVTWTIPEPPSANRIWRSARGRAGPYKPRQYKAWQNEAIWEIKFQGWMTFGDLPVKVRIVLPKGCRKDADNTCKPVNDLLQKAGVVVNDKQIRDTQAVHGTEAVCRITVETLGELGTQCESPSSPPR